MGCWVSSTPHSSKRGNRPTSPSTAIEGLEPWPNQQAARSDASAGSRIASCPRPRAGPGPAPPHQPFSLLSLQRLLCPSLKYPQRKLKTFLRVGSRLRSLPPTRADPDRRPPALRLPRGLAPWISAPADGRDGGAGAGAAPAARGSCLSFHPSVHLAPPASHLCAPARTISNTEEKETSADGQRTGAPYFAALLMQLGHYPRGDLTVSGSGGYPCFLASCVPSVGVWKSSDSAGWFAWMDACP